MAKIWNVLNGYLRSGVRACAALMAAVAGLALAAGPAHAAVGMSTIAAAGEQGRVTVFYPSAAAPARVERGRFVLELAAEGAPQRGNGRLVVISHGSGGSPWPHVDAAAALVEAGFIVAMPEHRGDNTRDPGQPGPESWTIRPREVSQAIDAIARDGRYAPLLDLGKVGVYGMSAGGHTALSLAGGRWSPALFVKHCEAHLAEDFQTCVGLNTQLTGSAFDGLREAVAIRIIRHRFAGDDRLRSDADPRIAAVVAGVPAAADFDLASLAQPRVPTGLITARQDLWLVPRFHADAVLAACKTCEHLLDIRGGGHGALLSPPPPKLEGLIGKLLNDPPGFDRPAATAEAHARLIAFFIKHLR